MALTLEAEQNLTDVGLVAFFDEHIDVWRALAQATYTFVRDNFPEGAVVRCDDVAKALLPLLEVHEELADCLNAKKLTQKYWKRYFADLILDRSWEQIANAGAQPNEPA